MKILLSKNYKKQRGITAIALVITIIVLLILAGISISMLSDDRSIFKTAYDSKENTDIAQEKEIIAMSVNASTIKNNRKYI